MDWPSAGTIGAFFVTSIAVELTPGPNMAYLALLGLSHGRVAGLFAVAGVALGLAVIGGLAAVGMASLVAQTPALYQGIRWAGIAYLIWLGYESWRDANAPIGARQLAGTPMGFFRRGLVTNLLNPKAAVFYIAVLPSFLAAEAPIGAFGLLVLVYVGAATLVHALIVLGAGALEPFVTRSGHRRALGAVFGAMLVGVAVWLAWSTAG
ncbi:LysE family translocator [Pelagibacterium montanilacus]|uniref:LysE family translocator n=1 Tax=Pelagibacterium montanilacus TaxID=2185280 RepID=UPI001FE39A11|nr:LysE family translocator [Pelagibacterium montanilacus]